MMLISSCRFSGRDDAFEGMRALYVFLENAQAQKRLEAAFLLLILRIYSNGDPGLYLTMRLGLFDAQSVEQPLQLTLGYRQTSIGLRRPSEATFFQSPVVQPKAIVVPAQDFQFIPPPVAEHEPLVRKRVKGEDGAYERRQSIDGFSQIGRPGCKEYPPHRFRV